jgi:hypothetical protein
MRSPALLTRRILMASTAGALVVAPSLVASSLVASRLARAQAVADAPVATDKTADAQG